MKKVALIGAGNINWHLGTALLSKHYQVCQVYSRTRKSALALSKKLDCKYTTSLNKIDTEAEIILIAVSDDAIPEVVKSLSYLENKNRLFVHTSGSTKLAILSKHFTQCGVFWPPQSIRKEQKINIKQTPFVVVAEEASEKDVLQFAKRLSSKITLLSEGQKSKLHMAAVFANNFTNHLFSVAYDICQEENLDFALLYPIIQQTIEKIELGDPSDFQTGPAIRGDLKTIKNHHKLLKGSPELKKIYTLLSKNINPKIK